MCGSRSEECQLVGIAAGVLARRRQCRQASPLAIKTLSHLASPDSTNDLAFTCVFVAISNPIKESKPNPTGQPARSVYGGEEKKRR
jgi:hypothetical protein